MTVPGDLVSIPPLRRPLACVAALAGLLAGGAPARAATIAVAPGAVTVAADGVCSLPEALGNANADAAVSADCAPGAGADTLSLGAGSIFTFGAPLEVLYGPTALPAVTGAVTLDGAGAALVRAAGAPAFRFFSVAPTGSLTLRAVHLSGGRATGGAGGEKTAADDGAGGGGGAGLGGAIFTRGTLRLERSTISGSIAEGGAGGSSVHADGGSDGGGGAGGGGLGGGGGSLTGDTGSDGAAGGGGYTGDGASSDSSAGGGGGGTSADGGGPANSQGGAGGLENGGAGGDDDRRDERSLRIASDRSGRDGGDGGGGGGGADEGAGGAGGYGGGGGGSGESDSGLDRPGGAGGFGGGGGGGGEDDSGGAGGFGGGGGGASSDGDAESPPQPGLGGYGAGSGGSFPADAAGGGGGGLGAGGAIFSDGGTVTVLASTLDGNRATGGAGGPGPVVLTKGPPAGSTAGADGQGLGGAIFARGGTLTVAHATLSANAAAQGAGIHVLRESEAPSAFVLQDTIVAGRGAGANDCTVDGTPSTAGSTANLVELSGGCPAVVSSTDPRLGPLAAVDGATPLRVPAADSPVLDAGGASPVTEDQRGLPVPSDLADVANAAGGDGSDLGAYERQAPVIPAATPVAGAGAGAPPAAAPPRTDPPPLITGTQLSRGIFGRLIRGRPTAGDALRFTLSEAATLTITVRRFALVGPRVPPRCARGSERRPGGPLAPGTVGRVTLRVLAGVNAATVARTFGRLRLGHGRYGLRLQAVDAAGQSSNVQRVYLTVC